MGDGSENTLAASQPGLTPIKLLQTYSSEEWEAFIAEWAEGFDPSYVQVVPLGGAGDKGRDILGHYTGPEVRPRPCDLFQCKHYDHPLHPTDAYLELGKLCVYTNRGDYPIPRRYRFVPPRGVGPALYDLLNHPEKLRSELVLNWDKYCRRAISKSEDFPLDGPLKTHVASFDFSIVWFVTPSEIVTQHQRTKYWTQRFKIDAPVRPDPPQPPEQLQPREMPYVDQLLGAYGDRLKASFALADLATRPDLQRHFTQSRGYFFSAEELARFSRDHFAPGSFDRVKQHVHDGIVDVVMLDHADGLTRLLEVMKQAAGMALPLSDLMPHVWQIGRAHV